MAAPVEEQAVRKLSKVNREAFERVAAQLEDQGDTITFEMLGDIFGNEFWMIIVYALMSAQDAARAIDGAMRKLSGREK